MTISHRLFLFAAWIGLSSACGEGFVSTPGSSTTTSGSGAGTGGTTVGAGGTTVGTGGVTAGTSGTTVGTGGTTGGTGGAAAEQDCTNGVDDDDDGSTDCADPDCGAFSCVPTPPEGWIAAWLDPSASPGLCPSELPQQIDLFDSMDLVAPPASCSCGCGDAVGVACGTHMRCDPNAVNCAAMGPANGQSTSCGMNIPNVSFPAFCRADPPGAFGGACEPKTLGSVPAWSWMPANRACASAASGACGDPGSACVPKLAGGIGPCIAQVGDLACPASYPSKTLRYDGKTVTDNRSCNWSACSCGDPVGSTCDCGPAGCTVELHGNGACGALQGSVPTNGVCLPVQSKPTAAKVVGVTPVPGACAALGAALPKGEVTPTAPVTVCCVQ